MTTRQRWKQTALHNKFLVIIAALALIPTVVTPIVQAIRDEIHRREELPGNPAPHPGTPKVMRFGIRNNGGTYGLAGGDPNLARMVVLPSGTVVVTLKEPIDPKATAVYVEGNTTPLPVTKVTPTSLQFRLPTIEPNGVAVIIINAE
jgi:hypothetical protein